MLPRYRDLTDEDLMGRARSGDKAAFAELVSRYEKPLYGYLYRHLRNPEQAQDAFQETWLRVLKALDRFDTNLRFVPWLYRIATNLMRDFVRRGKLRAHRSLDQPLSNEGDITLGDTVSGAELAPDMAAEGSDVGRHVEEAVRHLPARQREAFLLRHCHGLSYEEIASAQRCSLAAVKSNIHHAVVSLRRSLERLGLTPVANT